MDCRVPWRGKTGSPAVHVLPRSREFPSRTFVPATGRRGWGRGVARPGTINGSLTGGLVSGENDDYYPGRRRRANNIDDAGPIG